MKQHGNIHKSRSTPVEFGVPQGSILGPLLFLIYVNDLPSSTNLNVISFADDTTLYTAGSDMTAVAGYVNKELYKIHTWLNANKLALNVKKTKYMILGPKHSIPMAMHCNIKIENIVIQRISSKTNDTSVKFLGVELDENLTWQQHILMTGKKINNGLFALNQVKHILPTQTLITIYFALIHSHLTYCLEIWGGSSHITKLNK